MLPTTISASRGSRGYYEKALHGTTGYQEVEVDNHGRVVRLLKEVPPVAGKNLYLTLDLHLQQYIESGAEGAARGGGGGRSPGWRRAGDGLQPQLRS